MPVMTASISNFIRYLPPRSSGFLSVADSRRGLLESADHPSRSNSELRPVRLWKFRSDSSLCVRRKDGNQGTFLPLEQIRQRGDILAGRIKFDISLNALEGVARMQLCDELGIIETVVLRHNLRNDLSDRISFSNVGTDAVSRAAVLGQVSLDHVGITGVIGFRIPAVRYHDRFGGCGAANGLQELIALVGSGRCNQRLGV